MDINFQTHTHYVFPVIDRNNTTRLESLRYASDEQGGNLFGTPAILESLAQYGINHHVAVKAKTKDEAIQHAVHHGLTLATANVLNYIDRQKFTEAHEQYGSLDDIVHMNHMYKIEQRRPGYTVGELLRDKKPGSSYHHIGEVFTVPHPYQDGEQAKGVLYRVPTWVEAAFGKQRLLKRNSAIICLSDTHHTDPAHYLISEADEFDAVFRTNAKGLQTSGFYYRNPLISQYDYRSN